MRLEVCTNSSDIDILFLAPSQISRHRFFASLGVALNDMKNSGTVTFYRIVSDAIVPVVHLEMFNIRVEIQYVPLSIPLIHLNHFSEDQLQGLTPSDIKSIQGYTDIERVYSAIPQDLMPIYRMVLRTIRTWSKAREIDSNALGYFGGISYTGKNFI